MSIPEETKQRQPTLLERIENIEKSLPRLEELSSLRDAQITNQFRQALGNVIEVIQASLKVQGPEFDEKVQAEVAARRLAKLQDEADKAKNVLDALVNAKALVASEVITEKSVMVAKIYETSGAPIGVGRNQVEFAQLGEPLKKALLGNGVGARYEEDGAVFEVVEIYEPNQDASTSTTEEASQPLA